MREPGSVLLIDTCEERGSVALCRGGVLLEQCLLEERSASSSLAATVNGLLGRHGVAAPALRCVGVVNGPGSFTGVRVGLAFGKGFCLAIGVVLVTVSRLAVLAHAAQRRSGFAVIGAGRSAVYLRELGGAQAGREEMLEFHEARHRIGTGWAVFTAEALAEELGIPTERRDVVTLSAAVALEPALERLATQGDELVSADANYVRNEAAIYKAKQPGVLR